MKGKKIKRALILIGLISSLAIGLYIVVSKLNQSIAFFYTPTEIHTLKINKKNIKIGGIVKPGTIKRWYDNSSLRMTFTLTDCNHDISVEYQGNLPPLFREKQGIVALGYLDQNNNFIANQLLTKHDERYVPKENAEGYSSDSICNTEQFRK